MRGLEYADPDGHAPGHQPGAPGIYRFRQVTRSPICGPVKKSVSVPSTRAIACGGRGIGHREHRGARLEGGRGDRFRCMFLGWWVDRHRVMPARAGAFDISRGA